jgi:H+ antiporter protein
MLSVLANRTYRHLLSAQIIALVGTGLATVALGLLAYDIAGADAGAVLGTALAIKMIAYIGIGPIVGAFADRLPRRSFLVAMDMIRAGVALLLPFVDQIWHVYVLIFALQSASAAFTPTFQATIPDILPDEAEYTRALSLSRLAYDLESLLSPMLAAALLSVISFHWLFGGTAIGFIGSALLVLSVTLPLSPAKPREGGIYSRTTRGMRIYLKTPRLRGLLAVNLAAAAASAMVIVNTVVIVRNGFGFGQREVAFTLAAYGGGSMLAALALPQLLDRIEGRNVMLGGAMVLTVALAALGLASGNMTAAFWPVLLAGWFVMGMAYAAALTPSGLLLRRSAQAEDRPAVFAAQFALSHACWLVAYPLAGQVGARFGQQMAFMVLAALAMCGVVAALRLWPARDPKSIEHEHPDLPEDHPHKLQHSTSQSGHAHDYLIDDLHANWPR